VAGQSLLDRRSGTTNWLAKGVVKQHRTIGTTLNTAGSLRHRTISASVPASLLEGLVWRGSWRGFVGISETSAESVGVSVQVPRLSAVSRVWWTKPYLSCDRDYDVSAERGHAGACPEYR
jgi:hypothetical protein